MDQTSGQEGSSQGELILTYGYFMMMVLEAGGCPPLCPDLGSSSWLLCSTVVALLRCDRSEAGGLPNVCMFYLPPFREHTCTIAFLLKLNTDDIEQERITLLVHLNLLYSYTLSDNIDYNC